METHTGDYERILETAAEVSESQKSTETETRIGTGTKAKRVKSPGECGLLQLRRNRRTAGGKVSL